MNSANHSEASPSDDHPFARSRLGGREANPACSCNAKRQEDGGDMLRLEEVGEHRKELAFARCTPSLTASTTGCVQQNHLPHFAGEESQAPLQQTAQVSWL